MELVPGSYRVDAEEDGFFPAHEDFVLKGDEEGVLELDVILNPLEVGQTIKMENIFFELNKSNLDPKSFPELNELAAFLAKNSKMKIEIAGHTDNQGSESYNKKLSQNRVNSVVDYLIKQGVASNRLVGKGYGESKPVATNDTEEGRALNRRVEFTILSN